MAIVSLMRDNETPLASIEKKLQTNEIGHTGMFCVDLIHSDIPTAANTYVLGKIPVGSIVTNVTWVVTTEFTDGVDFGITSVAGVAGTDGDIDVLQDDSTSANHTVGVYTGGRGAHASNNFLGHNCITDSYISCSATADLSAGAGKLFVEYITP